MIVVLCLKKELRSSIKWFFKDKNNLIKSTWYFIYFFIPFLLVKMVHWLWFNQAAWESSWIWLSSNIHREIFSQFSQIFLKMDNYNLILIVLLFIFILSKKRRKKNESLFLYVWVVMLLILLAVFLRTEAYTFVMNQTTVNRVFTMCFIIILAFSWFLLNEE